VEKKMGDQLQVLIVDNDKSICRWLNAVLTAEGYKCRVAQSAEEAEPLLREEPIDVALLDIYLGGDNGLDFLEKLKVAQPQCNCVMMTSHPSVETVARSVAGGALEYVSKPLLIDELLALLRKIGSGHQSASTIAKDDLSPQSTIIGRSPKMLGVYRAIARVAPTSANVLISGASGTGKELVARAIHAHSPRASMPFTPINCGSFPDMLLENELFGHEKGAFTGADSNRGGLFEATDGGTVFLDEISETNLIFQVKLLRVVQEQQVRRLGSNTPIPVNVRILAATNKDLSSLIRTGQFREDLYYRLSGMTIQMPSLEERSEDIPLLVRHFLERFNQRNEHHVRISEDAVRLLTSMRWPGNVRELENLLERLAISTATDEIKAERVERGRAYRDVTAAAPDKLQEMERQ
jgi:DNA-binding NtrC family response regulator